MKVVERPSLGSLNTFALQARAGLLVRIESEEDLLQLPAFDPARDVVLGGGSNVVFASDVPGTVYLNRIPGRAVVAQDSDFVRVEVGAGEDWHGVVRWTLDQGLSGIENLSLIPGSAGAAPIQNIGAYGVELASVLEQVTAWDWRRAAWASFSRDECGLSYRDSRFKSADPDRYLVTSIRLRLARVFRPVLEYAGVREELAAAGITEPTARDVSDAVIRLRQRKLPDPAATGNVGSFFKNPVLGSERARALSDRHPGMVCWPSETGCTKLSAAWLVERCGLKGARLGDAAVSEQHALVIVNRGNASGREILELAHVVQARVEEKFGIRLEPEARVVEFAT